jgi:hypothetical protein
MTGQVTGRPRPQFRERHFDYAMRPSEYPQLLSIAAGQRLTVPFTFDTDAPFILRSRAMRVPYAVECMVNGPDPIRTMDLQHLRLRFSDATTEFKAQDTIRQLSQMAYFGNWGLPLPVYPGIFFPAGSTMQVDLYNDGTEPITNLTLYWRGVKLFPWGQRFDFTYPPKFATLPYSYTIATPTQANPTGGLLNLPASATLTNQVFQLQDDADFVIRSGQAGIPSGAVFEIFFQFYDSDKYPYSNYPIHADVLFGNQTQENIFEYDGSGEAAAPYLGGPLNPGLFYPEIYLPKSHLMYYDVVRSDGSISCASTVTYPLLLTGAKVFPQ